MTQGLRTLINSKYGGAIHENSEMGNFFFTYSEISNHGLSELSLTHSKYLHNLTKELIQELVTSSKKSQQNFLGSSEFQYVIPDDSRINIEFHKPEKKQPISGAQVFSADENSVITFKGKVMVKSRMKLRKILETFECQVCWHVVEISYLENTSVVIKPSSCDQTTGGCGRSNNQTTFKTISDHYDEFFSCKIKPDGSRKYIDLNVFDISKFEFYQVGKSIILTTYLIDKKNLLHIHVDVD
jgi:DNA replicative helicase MCM subunit Mcm2 (Cdc46/Mcm family)